MNSSRKRIALMVGGGSCVPWVLEALDPALASVVFGVSHKKESPGLDLISKHGGETELRPFLRYVKIEKQGSRDDYMREIMRSLANHEPNLIMTLGWDLILPDFFVSYFHEKGVRIANLHPSLVSASGAPVNTEFGLIPVIKGEVGSVIEEVLKLGLPAMGASLHIIPPTADVDQGPVLVRTVVKVTDGDTAATLEAKVHAAEKTIVRDFIRVYQTWGLPEPLTD